MTLKQRYNLNKLIYKPSRTKVKSDTVLYYKAYITIYENWANIVDGMDKETLRYAYDDMRKLYRKNVVSYLQTYLKCDTMYIVEIAKTYGADVLKLILEY